MRSWSRQSIPRAAGDTVYTAQEAKAAANRIGYPVLVRPSYVLGGQGMHIAFNDDEIVEFIDTINQIAQDHPILIDKYLMGKEIEVDAVCDGTDILIRVSWSISSVPVYIPETVFLYIRHRPSATCKRNDCRIYKTSGKSTSRRRTDQHSVHRHERRSICHRSKPAFFQNRTLYQ